MPPQAVLDAISRTARVEIVSHRHFRASYFLYRQHVHDDVHQVGYLVNGTSRVMIDGQVMTMQPGDAVVIAPHQWHGTAPDAGQEETEALQFKFVLEEDVSWRIPGRIHVDSRLEFETVFRAFLAEYHMRRPLREQMLRTYVAQLALILCRSVQRTGVAGPAHGRDRLRIRDERKVRQAMDWMAQHYAEPVSLRDVAASVGMSVSTLSHAFKALTGIPPIRYLVDVRLSQALVLMRQTDDKLNAIAEAVGFSSSNYFSRAFKKRFQETPRRYVDHMSANG